MMKETPVFIAFLEHDPLNNCFYFLFHVNLYMRVAPGSSRTRDLECFTFTMSEVCIISIILIIYLFWKADKITVLMWIQHQLKYIGGQRFFRASKFRAHATWPLCFYIFDMNMSISISIYNLDKLKRAH